MGQGDTGQLGQGDEVFERKKPGSVKGLDDIQIVQIVAGGMHSLALSSTGQVCGMKFNRSGLMKVCIRIQDGGGGGRGDKP